MNNLTEARRFLSSTAEVLLILLYISQTAEARNVKFCTKVGPRSFSLSMTN